MISYKDILSHETAQEFRRATQQYGMYCRGSAVIPCSVSERFKKALQDYREFLDINGIHMPPPRYRNFHRG